jgi:hypothetical protein
LHYSPFRIAAVSSLLPAAIHPKYLIGVRRGAYDSDLPGFFSIFGMMFSAGGQPGKKEGVSCENLSKLLTY